jgi:hypothetical protein
VKSGNDLDGDERNNRPLEPLDGTREMHIQIMFGRIGCKSLQSAKADQAQDGDLDGSVRHYWTSR